MKFPSKSLHATALAFSLLLGATGCGTPGTEQKAAQKAPVARAAASPADLLLVNALLRQSADKDTQQSLTLVTQAAAKAPDRLDIAWLQAQLCGQTPGCEPEPLETRLRKLDPDNGAVWLGPLARAQEQQDRAAEEQIIAALARTKRVDIYWNPLVARMSAAFGAQAAAADAKLLDPLTGAMNRTVNWLSGIVLPRFAPLGESCGALRVQKSQRAQQCAQIATALQNSDSYLAQGVGLGIAQRVATPGTASAQKVAARIANARYQQETTGEIISSQVDRDKFTRELLKLMSTLPREQDVQAAVLRWAGRPLEPTP